MVLLVFYTFNFMRYKLLFFLAIMPVFILVSCSKNKGTQQQEASKPFTNMCLGLASFQGMDALPAPDFQEGIGNSHLGITTKNKEAQRWFDQGLNHLHGFWHLEAYRAFKQVIRLDSTAAMAYWGLAMCAPGFGGQEHT
jgi:hypothetical protein